ncbi:MAG: CDP-glucose 4,6-dehydratase, partial [Halobacteriovoraceae bacterium]|nr:CDP-glucose 4,6-dehydratase [Halobacteriovoraceae bacterium]
YAGKNVLITGHTGFKGSWLSYWLQMLGANVHGFSISLPSEPSHFNTLNLDEKIASHTLGDIRSFYEIHNVINKVKPDIIFHLAAEAIVSTCIYDPIKAFSTNVMGTVNIMEALKHQNHCQHVVLITSDKCYENVEWRYGYRENDRLGGKDPYSASKACAELAISSFQRTYFNESEINMVSARAGNVIGGGDWAKDRIIPDCMLAWSKNDPVMVRSPGSTRPWQHVLEPLSGYLRLGEVLQKNPEKFRGESFNFGPGPEVIATVEELITEMKKTWPSGTVEYGDPSKLSKKESNLLKLNCDKAITFLDWTANLNFEETIHFTCDWYKNYYTNESTQVDTENQIERYSKLALERKKVWTS